MKLKKRKLTEEDIYKCLPQLTDENLSYRVERFSSHLCRVVIVSDYKYDYACGKEVWWVHSFIKLTDGSVMLPKNSEKTSSTRVCHLSNIPQRLNLTTITPLYTTLLSLFD